MRDIPSKLSRVVEKVLVLHFMIQQEGSEKQAQMERAIREKRAVESELEKVCICSMHSVSYTVEPH